MSSGARITSYLKEEVTPGVTPAAGSWDVLRLTGNNLTPTPTTEVSDEITESRVSQGSVVTGIEITGDLAGEFSYGTFDKLLAAAFYGNWVDDELTISDVRRTFSVAKNFNDINVFAAFKGMHVSTFALDVPETGKITATFGMMGLDYVDSAVNGVAATNPPTTTPFLSSKSVGTITVDGEDMTGVACISAFTFNIDNSLQTQNCLGSGKMGPGALIATEAAITGSITMAWSATAWEIWKNSFTRKAIAVAVPFEDSLGNQYLLSLPSIEVDGELPSGGKRDLVQVTLNYTVAKEAPVLTRTPAVETP